MWRIVGFISGLALTVGGAGWLVFQLFIAEDFSSNLIVAAVTVLAMGAHWLWGADVRLSLPPRFGFCFSLPNICFLRPSQRCGRQRVPVHNQNCRRAASVGDRAFMVCLP
jgi:hypothetical protein